MALTCLPTMYHPMGWCCRRGPELPVPLLYFIDCHAFAACAPVTAFPQAFPFAGDLPTHCTWAICLGHVSEICSSNTSRPDLESVEIAQIYLRNQSQSLLANMWTLLDQAWLLPPTFFWTLCIVKSCLTHHIMGFIWRCKCLAYILILKGWGWKYRTPVQKNVAFCLIFKCAFSLHPLFCFVFCTCTAGELFVSWIISQAA